MARAALLHSRMKQQIRDESIQLPALFFAVAYHLLSPFIICDFNPRHIILSGT
jgi:hypothetical protein